MRFDSGPVRNGGSAGQKSIILESVSPSILATKANAPKGRFFDGVNITTASYPESVLVMLTFGLPKVGGVASSVRDWILLSAILFCSDSLLSKVFASADSLATKLRKIFRPKVVNELKALDDQRIQSILALGISENKVIRFDHHYCHAAGA